MASLLRDQRVGRFAASTLCPDRLRRYGLTVRVRHSLQHWSLDRKSPFIDHLQAASSTCSRVNTLVLSIREVVQQERISPSPRGISTFDMVSQRSLPLSSESCRQVSSGRAYEQHTACNVAWQHVHEYRGSRHGPFLRSYSALYWARHTRVSYARCR